jgi:glycosyltransferase involved in cell wall biosynthesis
VDRFAHELLRLWMPQFGAQFNARIFVPAKPGYRARTDSLGDSPELVGQPVGKLGGQGWEQLELPAYCRDALLLNLCNTGPITRSEQLCVLHDAGALVNASSYSLAFRTWYRWLFTALMRRARIIATVSKFSASELMRLFGKRKALEVIYESGEHILREPADSSVLERLGLAGERYVLAVGSRAPHKNFAAIVRAVAMLGDDKVKVVAAGGADSRVYASFALPTDSLVMAGYVSNGQLRALYENAQCFVFPSLYEGFGLPPLEAMCCGCPTIVSDRAALPEVCGNGALYCDPLSPADIARQLRQVLASASLRQELRERGLARARSFTWQLAAEQLQALVLH